MSRPVEGRDVGGMDGARLMGLNNKILTRSGRGCYIKRQKFGRVTYLLA